VQVSLYRTNQPGTILARRHLFLQSSFFLSYQCPCGLCLDSCKLRSRPSNLIGSSSCNRCSANAAATTHPSKLAFFTNLRDAVIGTSLALHVAENTTSPHHLIKHSCSFLFPPNSPMPETIIRRGPASPIRSTACGPLPHSTQPRCLSIAQLFIFPPSWKLLHTHRRQFSSHWLPSSHTVPSSSPISALWRIASPPASLIPLQQGGGLGPCRPLFSFPMPSPI
jgi:hypothetical protein